MIDAASASDLDARKAAAKRSIQHEGDRMATLVWWGRYTLRDAILELRGWVHIVSRELTDADTNAIADKVLNRCLEQHQADHDESMQVLINAARAAIRAGGNLATVRTAVAHEAATRPRAVPMHLLAQAIDAAAAQHRSAEKWWKMRGRAE